MHLLHCVVAVDGEGAAFDNNLRHLRWVRVRIHNLALDRCHRQGDGGVFAQGGRDVQVHVHVVADRPVVVGCVHHNKMNTLVNRSDNSTAGSSVFNNLVSGAPKMRNGSHTPAEDNKIKNQSDSVCDCENQDNHVFIQV